MEFRSVRLTTFLLMISTIWTYDSECPPPWLDNADSCIKFDNRSYPLTIAEEWCNGYGARLLSINNQTENNVVINWLQNEADKLRKWYTSGRFLNETEPSVFWEGDGSSVTDSIYWLDPENIGTGDRIVYAYADDRWGWQLVDPIVDLSFICEIPKDEIYRILEEEDDFCGMASTDTWPTVRGPMFTKQPHDVIYHVDSTEEVLSIECVAFANPPPLYEWWQDQGQGMNLVDPMANDRYTITDGKLTIHRPNQDVDSGDYYCRAHNIFGTVLSNKVEIRFGYLLEFPRASRDTVTVQEFAGAAIGCNPPRHYPEILYLWTKDSVILNLGTSLTTNPRAFISRNGRLYFSDVTSDDNGEYFCHLSRQRTGATSLPGRISRPIPLRVIEAVAAIHGPQIANGFPAHYPRAPLQGDNVAIECFAWGTNELEYSWERVKGTMPAKAYLSDRNRVLHIPKVQTMDQGSYHCTCVRRGSDAQSDSATVILHVDAVPFFNTPIRDQHIDIGGTMALHCIADGIPTVLYSWYINGTKLTLDIIEATERPRFTVHHNSLIITDMKEADQGMYQCAASNVYGTRYSTAQIRVRCKESETSASGRMSLVTLWLTPIVMAVVFLLN